jgi:hypothetical protein
MDVCGKKLNRIIHIEKNGNTYFGMDVRGKQFTRQFVLNSHMVGS